MEIPNLDKVAIDFIFDNSVKFNPSNINRVIDDLIKTIKDSNLLNRRKEVLSRIEELEKSDRTIEEDKQFNVLCLELIEINKKINQDN